MIRLLVEPGLGFRMVPGGHAGERDAGDAAGQPSGQSPANGAEARYGDAGAGHGETFPK